LKQWVIRLLAILLLTGLILAQAVLPSEAAETGIVCGGINILKTDVLGTGLPGAGFQIAREATKEELTNSAVPKRLLKVGKDVLAVVYDSFWDCRSMDGERKTEVITADDGTAAIYGLPYGTYYLVESRAPEGYNQMTSPVRVSIHKYSHLTAEDDIRDDENVVIDNTVHIITIRYSMPETENGRFLRICAAIAALLVFPGMLYGLKRLRQRCES